MCGIVGYIGDRPVLPLLLDGLRRLEYRGYDSAGVAVLDNGRPVINKSAGRIETLAMQVKDNNTTATVGIGHTRWATHGEPNDINAHPHADCRQEVVCVHNGIIENFRELKSWLTERGHDFTSEADTEVIPHLIEHCYQESGDLAAATRQAAARLRGSYAVVVMSSCEPGRLVAMRQSSPLIIGLGEGEHLIASDIPAILQYTRRVVVLQDGEFAVVDRERVDIHDIEGNPVEPRPPLEINWDPEMAERGGYPHFMLKEIHEQPDAVVETLRGRLGESGYAVSLEDTGLDRGVARRVNRVFITACGTAYHAGLVGKRLLEGLARVPVEVDLASEFRYRDPLIAGGDLLIAVSQSGETADTLAAVREARLRGARVLAITNVAGSSITREADYVMGTRAGPEIAVASTKAYVTQLVAFFLIALFFANARDTLDEEVADEAAAGLRALPRQLNEVLELSDRIREIAAWMAESDDVFFIGRGLDYAVCLEGQLKLKEISYIHAEALAAGELKHGTLALIEPGVPVVALATQAALLDKTMSNVIQVRARGGEVVGIAPRGTADLEEHAREMLELPAAHELVAPVLGAVAMQLISYYAAVARGCDVDKPRNLAKSVTVE